MKDNQPFSIKKNALVIIENKLKFPSLKDKIVEFIKIILKKLNFIIKLLIYDNVIVNRDEFKKIINI